MYGSIFVGGIVFATRDLMAMGRVMSIARAISSNADPRISIKWLGGMVNLREVNHPYLWAGIGGFLPGALIGMALSF